MHSQLFVATRWTPRSAEIRVFVNLRPRDFGPPTLCFQISSEHGAILARAIGRLPETLANESEIGLGGIRQRTRISVIFLNSSPQ